MGEGAPTGRLEATITRRILAVVPELMAAVRIEEAAKRLGADFAAIESRAELDALLPLADVLIIDLGVEDIAVPDAVRDARSHGVEVIAFGPHVDAGRLRAARAAGVRRLYTRGKFLRELSRVLAEALAARG
ncbi:MAG: hypothetical protein Q7T33_08530 [Dehalococcoidia bacterium]|nr:hypothetical protein [Dehalococcoidia bacterium]